MRIDDGRMPADAPAILELPSVPVTRGRRQIDPFGGDPPFLLQDVQDAAIGPIQGFGFLHY